MIGYVVLVPPPRGSKDNTEFVCDYEKAPEGFGKAVGLGDLQVAEFFTDRYKASNTAFWQHGVVKRAMKTDGKIILI